MTYYTSRNHANGVVYSIGPGGDVLYVELRDGKTASGSYEWGLWRYRDLEPHDTIDAATAHAALRREQSPVGGI